jgi:hypothetical protein
MELTQQTQQTQQTQPASRTGTRLRAAGIAGLAAAVLLFGGQGFILASGTAEPAFGASAAEIQRFWETRDTALFSTGSYLMVLGLVAFLWFVCGVYTAVRGDGGQHQWLPTVALASGVAAVGPPLLDAWQLAVFRAGEGLDPQLGRFAFDMGNLGFASAWVALGSFAIAVGWAALSSRSLPGWLGWWAVAAGVGLVAARAVWTSPAWFVPYALFWLWVLVLSVRFLAGRSPSQPGSPGGTRP